MKEEILTAFDLQKTDIRTLSPLTLAFIGDCVFELIIRTVIVEEGNDRPDRLAGRTRRLAQAHTQALIYETLLPYLTPEEEEAARRGRNAKSASTAKHASVSDYRKATGLEALFGYLYLTDRTGRAAELAKIAAEALELL